MKAPSNRKFYEQAECTDMDPKLVILIQVNIDQLLKYKTQTEKLYCDVSKLIVNNKSITCLYQKGREKNKRQTKQPGV